MAEGGSIKIADNVIFDPNTNRYIHLQEKIASGGYGTVYKGWIPELSIKVAVKVAAVFDESLKREQIVYELIGSQPEFPDYFGYTDGAGFSSLTIELLGCDLSKVIMEIIKGELDTVTVSLMMISLIRKLKIMHEHGYTHCDIKPQNILIGRKSKRDTLYLCDFGLSTKFDLKKANEHRHFRGTITFASQAAHARLQQCPQDDLESLGYTIMALCEGIKLEWESCLEEDIIIDYKELQYYDITAYRHFPPIMEYMNIVTLPTRHKMPDYDILIRIFEKYLRCKTPLCLSWMSAKFADNLQNLKCLYSSEDETGITKASMTKDKKKIKKNKKCIIL